MKFLRFDDAGNARLGVLRVDAIVPLDSFSADYPTTLDRGRQQLGAVLPFEIAQRLLLSCSLRREE